MLKLLREVALLPLHYWVSAAKQMIGQQSRCSPRRHYAHLHQRQPHEMLAANWAEERQQLQRGERHLLRFPGQWKKAGEGMEND